jgi:hypothetical protein
LTNFRAGGKIVGLKGAVCVGGNMRTRRFNFQFAGPEKLRALQEIFDIAWQEINALDHRQSDGDNSNRLRRELAEAIMSACNLEPTVIKEGILHKIRSGILFRNLHAPKIQSGGGVLSLG